MRLLFFTGCLLLCQIGFGQSPAALLVEKTDLSTIDGFIGALYGSISGPAGEARDWEFFKTLFREDAKLRATPLTRDSTHMYWTVTVDEYIARSSSYFTEQGFFEEEIHREIQTFGPVSHVFSTYVSKRTADGPIFMRGINSIQLVFLEGRYWIASILWNAESKLEPIPDRYLPGTDGH